MADPAGILLHVQLIAASHDMVEALTKPSLVPGATLAAQEREVLRRTAAWGKAYNESLAWAKDAAKQLGVDRG